MRIVGGKNRGRSILAPKGSALRPTSDRTRESLFNILEHGVEENGLEAGVVLDVFAGTGALGLEALSRGAAWAVFIDNDPISVRQIKKNAAGLGEAQNVYFLKLDANRLPPPPRIAKMPATLVFLDAPYDQGLTEPALLGLAAKGWIAEKALVVVEISATETFNTPRKFKLLDDRSFGAARILFLRYSQTKA
jgi:16S rRNA (guanine966-N2)-methyltransferase